MFHIPYATSQFAISTVDLELEDWKLSLERYRSLVLSCLGLLLRPKTGGSGDFALQIWRICSTLVRCSPHVDRVPSSFVFRHDSARKYNPKNVEMTVFPD